MSRGCYEETASVEFKLIGSAHAGTYANAVGSLQKTHTNTYTVDQSWHSMLRPLLSARLAYAAPQLLPAYRPLQQIT